MARQSKTTTNATAKNSASKQPEKLLKSGVPASVGKDYQWKPGQSGNPAGPKPGYKHLSTHIQELLNDEEFQAYIPDARSGFVEFKGAPMTAILKALAIKATQGDVKAFDALAKYGYGTKVEVEGDVKGELIVKLVSYKDDGSNPAS